MTVNFFENCSSQQLFYSELQITLEQLLKCLYVCPMEKINETPVCGITYIDDEKVKNVKNELPNNDLIIDASDILKVLSDPTRLKIVMALSKEELCVCDLSALVSVSVSAVSHQLRLLRGQHLVKYNKKGKMVYYSLSDNHINNIIAAALEHAEELQK